MINWRHYKDLPDTGRMVVVLDHHWKDYFPSSMAIYGGVVELSSYYSWQVHTDDMSGHGSLRYNAGENHDFIYWCYAEEFWPIVESVFPKKDDWGNLNPHITE